MLESKRFSFFWCSRVAFGMGNHMQITVVGWHLYELARTAGSSIEQAAFLLGLIGLVKVTPQLVFAFIGGAVADRFDQRKVLMWTYLARALVPLCLLLVTLLLPRFAIPAIFVVTFIGGCIYAFLPSANANLLPRLVERHRLSKAIAGISSGVQGGVVAGPLIGGVAFALAPAMAYFLCALTYLFSMIMVYLIRVDARPAQAQLEKSRAGNLAAMAEGLRFILSNKLMRGAISLDAIVCLLGGAVILLPAIARDVLLLGPSEMGMLRSSMAVGGSIAAFSLWRFPLQRYLGRWMFGATMVYGLGTIGFGLSPNFKLALFFLMVVGASDMMSTVVRQTLLQLIPPDHLRGRAAAFVFTSHNSSIELGNFESGLVARFFGPVQAVVIGGAAALTASGLWMYLFPDLRKRDKLESD